MRTADTNLPVKKLACDALCVLAMSSDLSTTALADNLIDRVCGRSSSSKTCHDSRSHKILHREETVIKMEPESRNKCGGKLADHRGEEKRR